MIIGPSNAMIGMRGFQRMRCINRKTGKVRLDTGWYRNKLLTSGMNQMGSIANWLTHCHVGTNNTPASNGDTQLYGLLATSGTIVEDSWGSRGSAPFYGWRRKTWRFSGAAIENQNINEAGMGWGTNPDNLVSRALVLDPVTQTATTVVPLPGELLDVLYELRYYPPLVDVLGTVTLNGVDYDTVTRAAGVTSAAWSERIGTQLGAYNPYTDDNKVYDGPLGTIEQYPSGTSANPQSQTAVNSPYSNNSFTRVMTVTADTTGWNLVAGIRSVRLRTSAGWYQTSYSSNPGGNTIPKDVNNVIALAWNLHWGELGTNSTWTMIAADDAVTPANGQWNTNVTGTLLRISWVDSGAVNNQAALEATSGTIFRIRDNTDPEKWVEYTTSGAHSPQSGFTQYSVTQSSISNAGGPGIGNICTIKEIKQ